MKVPSIVNSYYKKGAEHPAFPWNTHQNLGIEDLGTECEEASSRDEQGDQGDLAEVSRECQNKDSLKLIESKP